MANLIGIMGEPGSGKSTSLDKNRNRHLAVQRRIFGYYKFRHFLQK